VKQHVLFFSPGPRARSKRTEIDNGVIFDEESAYMTPRTQVAVFDVKPDGTAVPAPGVLLFAEVFDAPYDLTAGPGNSVKVKTGRKKNGEVSEDQRVVPWWGKQDQELLPRHQIENARLKAEKHRVDTTATVSEKFQLLMVIALVGALLLACGTTSCGYIAGMRG